MYHHTKHEISMSTGLKVIAQTGTHTDRHHENITSNRYAGGNKVVDTKYLPDTIYSHLYLWCKLLHHSSLQVDTWRMISVSLDPTIRKTNFDKK